MSRAIASTVGRPVLARQTPPAAAASKSSLVQLMRSFVKSNLHLVLRQHGVADDAVQFDAGQAHAVHAFELERRFDDGT